MNLSETNRIILDDKINELCDDLYDGCKNLPESCKLIVALLNDKRLSNRQINYLKRINRNLHKLIAALEASL